MPFKINADKNDTKDKEIVMGGSKEPVADYYPPGTTEPIVRPAHIPAEQKEDPKTEPKEEAEEKSSPPRKAASKKK